MYLLKSNSSALGALLTPWTVGLCDLQLCVYLYKCMICLAERKTKLEAGFNQKGETQCCSQLLVSFLFRDTPTQLCPRVLMSPGLPHMLGGEWEFCPNRNLIQARKPKSYDNSRERTGWRGERSGSPGSVCTIIPVSSQEGLGAQDPKDELLTDYPSSHLLTV